jgi:hypothetical protein
MEGTMSGYHTCIHVGIAGLAIVGWSCASDASGPVPAPGPDPVASAIALVSGTRQSGEVLASLAAQIVVRVTDQNGDSMAGAPVTFEVTGGGGRVEHDTVVTDGRGLAGTAWIMGPDVRTSHQSVTARLAGRNITPVYFSATAMLSAGTVTVAAGNHQSGQKNALVHDRPAIMVKTPGPQGVPVIGVVVHWEITAGNGSISDAASTTDEFGVASIDWTLGSAVGADNQGLRATVAGLGGSSVAFVAGVAPPPATISKLSGDLQTGTVRQLLPAPLIVVVRDSTGAPVAGVEVHWDHIGDPTEGAGYVSPSTSVTDASGRASATFTLPEWAGPAGWPITADVGGLQGSPVSFEAAALPGRVAVIAAGAGNSQVGPAGSLLPIPLSVHISDEFGNPEPGTTVYWAANPGSGATTAVSSVTDSAGNASVGWVIGSSTDPNSQIVLARVFELPGWYATFYASATLGPPGP